MLMSEVARFDVQVLIDGRPAKSKKEIKETVVSDVDRVSVRTVKSVVDPMGTSYNGPLAGLPENLIVDYVGPIPESDRRFYGSIIRQSNKITVL